MTLDLSYRPNVLYLASIERMITARRLISDKPRDYVVAAYLAGLAVESIMQAIAIRHGAAADARHDLRMWLNGCPVALRGELRGMSEWSYLVAVWDNNIRYLSFNGLVGYLRKKEVAYGRRGGVESIVRGAVQELVDSAHVVHQIGIVQWQNSTQK